LQPLSRLSGKCFIAVLFIKVDIVFRVAGVELIFSPTIVDVLDILTVLSSDWDATRLEARVFGLPIQRVLRIVLIFPELKPIIMVITEQRAVKRFVIVQVDHAFLIFLSLFS
jgi:hypothetical protein